MPAVGPCRPSSRIFLPCALMISSSPSTVSRSKLGEWNASSRRWTSVRRALACSPSRIMSVFCSEDSAHADDQRVVGIKLFKAHELDVGEAHGSLRLGERGPRRAEVAGGRLAQQQPPPAQRLIDALN